MLIKKFEYTFPSQFAIIKLIMEQHKTLPPNLKVIYIFIIDVRLHNFYYVPVFMK